MKEVVRDRDAMIAAMDPVLRDGRFIFCTTASEAAARACREAAIGMFVEAEGQSFLLPAERARALGFETDQEMCQITLNVHSALDGVGLTAAVATVLAACDIPCNMVAAYHHDHVFVPAESAAAALAALLALQRAHT